MANTTFHNPDTIRQVFFNDRFARMKWLVDNFEKNAREIYRHTLISVTDEILRNFYSSFSCDFKIYLPDKSRKYGLLLIFKS